MTAAARKQRRIGAIMLPAGGAALGAGWALAAFHGLLGEVAGVECHDFLRCENTDDYGEIYIPVVGPILEAARHRGVLSNGEKVFLAVESVFQIGGFLTMMGGLTLRYSGPSARPASGASGAPATASLPFTFSVAPVVTPQSAGLGVVGTF